MDSAPKKLDAVDKWRARVLFRDPLPATDTWGKRIERQMAVLRVSFPFLTEKQLRGKAWTACGLRSLMGELPRSGLSPQVKKEFMKRGKYVRFAMSPKPKIKKEPTVTDKKESELSTYSYMFDNSGTAILIPQDNVASKDPSKTSFNSLNPANLLSINESRVLSINSSESLKKRKEKRKLKPKKVDFDIQENLSSINIKIPTMSEASWREANIGEKSKNPYCSQISKEKITFLQSKEKYTPQTISEFSTATKSETNKNSISTSMNLISEHEDDEQCDILQKSQFHTNELQNTQKSNELFNIDSGSAFFECNMPAISQNYSSNPIINKELILHKSVPIESGNTEDSTIIFKSLVDVHQTDGKSSENQQVKKSLSASCSKKYADSLSQDSNSDFNSNGVTTQGYQSCDSINVSQNADSTIILSHDFSLPSTPQEPLLNQPLLSNLCCEYNKACSKEEYKPVPYINSNNIVRKLKEDYDKIIPPEVSLTKYFEAEEKSFEQVQSEVHEKVNTIILALEDDKSTKTNEIDN